MTINNVSEAAKAVVRRNTEEVQAGSDSSASILDRWRSAAG